MTTLPSAGQEQPSLRVLQRKSSNIARQTAAHRSTSAYAVAAVGSKVHRDPASASSPPPAVNPVMAETAGNVHSALLTQPPSDASANVSSVEAAHTALTASIPGQVDTQERRLTAHLLPANSHCQSIAYFKTADQAAGYAFERVLIKHRQTNIGMLKRGSIWTDKTCPACA